MTAQISLPKKPWMRLAVAVVALAVVAAGVFVGVKKFTGLPGDAAFELRDNVVTKAELHERADLLEALYGIKQPTDADGKDSFNRDVAKAVAVSMILDHAAHGRDIVIADKQARDTLANMIDDQLGPDGNSEFTKILGEFGVNEDNVLEEIKRQQAIARLFQEVTKDAVASVSPEVARDYFDQNPSRFATPERRQLRNIVVATRKQANRLLARLRAGEDFSDLAAKTSLDESTRSSGGDLGAVSAAQLEDGYADAAFSARSGGVFGPVETKFGWNVGQVDAVKPGARATYSRVRDQVRDVVRSERAMAAWRAFLTDLIKKADVEYADDYRPDDPDSPPNDQPGVPSTSPEEGQ